MAVVLTLEQIKDAFCTAYVKWQSCSPMLSFKIKGTDKDVDVEHSSTSVDSTEFCIPENKYQMMKEDTAELKLWWADFSKDGVEINVTHLETKIVAAVRKENRELWFTIYHI